MLNGNVVDARVDRGALFAIASWSHAEARVEASGAAAALDGLRPAQTPSDAVTTTLGWRRDRATASVTMRYLAGQFEDDQNSRRLAPATVFDAYAALPLTRALALEARVENAFDSEVQTGITGADVVERATPRTWWLGLSVRG